MRTLTDQQWDAFVEAHPDATFFHRAGWRHVAPKAFGHKAHYLSVADDAGQVTGVLPLVEVRSRLFGHALISNAFTVGGGPLAANETARGELLSQAEALGQRLGVDYVELRDTSSAQAGWVGRDDLYANFEGPIAASEEDNLLQIPRKQRAVLRKALARGLTTSIDRTPDDFFALYSGTMRDHGTPALPKRYFEALFAAFGADCEVLSVHHEGRPVSSVLSFYFRNRVMPYYTGSAEAARATGSNDVMYWSVMRRALERGCDVFDFGRSKVGTGPHAFKRNWGFEPRPIAHQYRLVKGEALPNVNPTNPKYALMIKAWRRLPLPVANAVSPLLSRSLA
jgi:FemAB-related protein (PEP-CTERM system-associated)